MADMVINPSGGSAAFFEIKRNALQKTKIVLQLLN